MNTPGNTPKVNSSLHEFKDSEDGICSKCGFDGAEWHHWKHHTYEGKASNIVRMPPCDNQYVKNKER